MGSKPPRLSLRRALIGLGVAIFLYALLEPVAWFFYELHHLTGVGFIYYFYSAFRAFGYYFGAWEYHGLTSVLIGVLSALPWWEAMKSQFRRKA